MQTLKEVKQSLAESYYEGWYDEDNVMTKKQLVQNRIDDFEYCDPENEENIFWDAGYIRGYEIALKELQNEIKTNQGNNGGIVSYIQNLLDN